MPENKDAPAGFSEARQAGRVNKALPQMAMTAVWQNSRRDDDVKEFIGLGFLG
jgi:hypothetical protein